MSRRGSGGGGGGVALPTESTRLLGPGQQLPLTGGAPQPPAPARHQHAHPEAAAVEVDPVERMVQHALAATAVFLLLCFLGVLALVLKGLGFARLPWLARLPPALHSYWAVFAPFWLADAVGLLLVVEVLYGVCTLRATTRDEKRAMARVPPRGRPAHHAAYNSSKVVSMEMFPLVQTLLRGVLAALPFLACFVAAQVLFCLRLEAARLGHPSGVAVWQALLPVLGYQALCLLGALCLRHGSWLQAVAWALALAATLALALRLTPGAWPAAADAPALRPLWVALTPLWALEAFLLLLLARVALQAGQGACCRARRYKLRAQHVACIALYALSLLLFAAAQALVAWRRAWEDALDGAFPSLVDGGGGSAGSSSSSRSGSSKGGDSRDRSSHGVSEPPLPPPSDSPGTSPGLAGALAGIAVFCGAGLALLALYLLAAEAADHLVTSHGYEDPLPLSRTAKGWEPTGARTSAWLLLGRIEETARLMRREQAAAGRAGAVGMGMGIAMGIAMGGGRGGQAGPTAARGRDLDSPARPEGGELQRSNSGSYADLYADL